MKLWIVGKPMIVGGEEVGWMPEGIYETESEAASAASEDEFIALVTVGQRMPENAEDAEKLYFPKLETWEESTLFKARRAP